MCESSEENLLIFFKKLELYKIDVKYMNDIWYCMLPRDDRCRPQL